MSVWVGVLAGVGLMGEELELAAPGLLSVWLAFSLFRRKFAGVNLAPLVRRRCWTSRPASPSLAAGAACLHLPILDFVAVVRGGLCQGRAVQPGRHDRLNRPPPPHFPVPRRAG